MLDCVSTIGRACATQPNDSASSAADEAHQLCLSTTVWARYNILETLGRKIRAKVIDLIFARRAKTVSDMDDFTNLITCIRGIIQILGNWRLW